MPTTRQGAVGVGPDGVFGRVISGYELGSA